MVNHEPVIDSAVHFSIAAQVFVCNWVNVFAVTVPWQCGLVDMIHTTIQATKVLFPMPWPEAVAMRMASTGCIPSNPRAATSCPSCSRNSRASHPGL